MDALPRIESALKFNFNIRLCSSLQGNSSGIKNEQKVVIKLPLNGKRSSCKAMQIAVGVPGVASAAFAGEDKNQIEVTGDGIDAVTLTMLLRRNVGFAELVSVAPVSEDNKSGDDNKSADDQSESEKEVAVVQIPWYYNNPYGYGPGHMYVIRDQNPASCSIM
ncbi:hypothetical protein RHMOL_Rhmol06G0252200 [Rhododendron molle]|uniref:Uncharacterized protein n=1 Tax=Rhododendron molle TaxID=49168 RepID=A0ACC0NG65_RHOML|nr:hypothetical protein RHMOL_Rhmol06G0252200 [Rhododendron molle]